MTTMKPKQHTTNDNHNDTIDHAKFEHMHHNNTTTTTTMRMTNGKRANVDNLKNLIHKNSKRTPKYNESRPLTNKINKIARCYQCENDGEHANEKSDNDEDATIINDNTTARQLPPWRRRAMSNKFEEKDIDEDETMKDTATTDGLSEETWNAKCSTTPWQQHMPRRRAQQLQLEMQQWQCPPGWHSKQCQRAKA